MSVTDERAAQLLWLTEEVARLEAEMEDAQGAYIWHKEHGDAEMAHSEAVRYNRAKDLLATARHALRFA